jgi:hypothetical protein
MKQQKLPFAAQQLTKAALKTIKGGDFPPYETFAVCSVAEWDCFFTLEACEANCAGTCRVLTGCPVGMP